MTLDPPPEAEPSAAPVDNTAASGIAKRRRRRRIAGGAALLFLLAFVLCVYMGVLGGNVRVVEPGRLYRTAQLTGNGYTAISAHIVGVSLDFVIEQDHIQTIINLRGGSPKDAYYADEVAICARLHVAHVDDAFSARRLPSPEALHKLLDTFDNGAYPMAIHCQAGADRTGLACTIYANLYEHIPLDRAESEELTWRYGHISVGKTHAMDEFFTLYRETGHGKGLREWIETDYPALYAKSPLKMDTPTAPQEQPPGGRTNSAQ